VANIFKLPKALCKAANQFLAIADFLNPLASVAIRLWIANIFWKSGLTKISNWDSTIILFANEYKVPFLPAEAAACLATAVELSAPVLLVIGLAARVAAVPLLFMTAIIEFTYQSHHDHVIWAIFLGLILLQGPGRFSWDYFIRQKSCGEKEVVGNFSSFVAFMATLALSLFASYHVFGIMGR